MRALLPVRADDPDARVQLHQVFPSPDGRPDERDTLTGRRIGNQGWGKPRNRFYKTNTHRRERRRWRPAVERDLTRQFNECLNELRDIDRDLGFE